MNAIDLRGRCAVVTGGAGGIGGGIMARLTASGARVAVWDRAPADGEAAALHVETDVTDEAAVAAAMATTLDAFGRLDILVAAAGATGPAMATADYAWDEWQRIVTLNLGGVFLANRAALGPMLAAGYGRIVNVASIAGREGNVNLAAYSAAKAGVIALTKVIGREAAASGICVNAVAPGLVCTPILDQLSPTAVQRSLSLIPRGRAGQVEEIAAMVAFLVSEDCSFTTGATFDVSGGRGVS